MSNQEQRNQCYAINTNNNRPKPADLRIKHHREQLTNFLTHQNEYYCINDIYHMLIKMDLLRGKSKEETEDKRNIIEAITSQELLYRLEELVKQGLIEFRVIRKISENARTEIEVKYYGVKGAIINDEVADNYANFVIRCRDITNRNFSNSEIEFMKNLVYRIICEQKFATNTYTSADRISGLSIDFTTDTVKYFLNILVAEGKVKVKIKIENDKDHYSKVPNPSRASTSIS